MKQTRLLIEYLVLFIAIPFGLRWLLQYYPGYPVLPFLWLAGVICGYWLWKRPHFDRRELTRMNISRRFLAGIVLRFSIFALVIGIGMAWLAPERFLRLPLNYPLLWLLIMLLYPVLSVYPQGIIYRGFMFHRYAPLFPRPWTMTIASALAFALVHLVFDNLPAVGLTAIAGVMFAWTYRQTKSIAVSSLEHALYGCFIFTVGLGEFFYHGR
jgi:membrane protease YdiL (CAAX protease family)